MKYEEFRQTIEDIEKFALDTVFTFSGKFYEDRFAGCAALANELLNVDVKDAEKAAELLSKVPVSYASASLFIMKKFNNQKKDLILKIRENLTKIYVKDFNKSISKKIVKFAMVDKHSIENYLSLKSRFVDDNEIIRLAKALGVKINDVIGDYKGEDKTTSILSKAMHRIRFNVVQEDYKDVIEKIIITSLDDATKQIKKLTHQAEV